jgi:hypothetical protein
LVVTHLRKGADDGDPIDKISGTLGLSGGADAFLILDSNSTGQTIYGRGRDLEEIAKLSSSIAKHAAGKFSAKQPRSSGPMNAPKSLKP